MARRHLEVLGTAPSPRALGRLTSRTRVKPGENAAAFGILPNAGRDLKGVHAAPEHSSFASLSPPIYPFQHSFAS